VLHRFLRRQVVRPFSGACYFDASIRIPNSNHSTIAKPTGPDALQHRLLLQFVVKFLQSPTAEVTGAESPITTIYDLSLKYAEEAFDEVKRIFGEAYTWVERGIGAGSSSAMYFLGQCYFEGSGVQQDVNEAFGWFEKAAMAGDVDAMYKVAVMYKEGVGVPLNLEKFHEWINKAADLGHKDAIESRSKASSTS
jgi:TPR repeat protein